MAHTYPRLQKWQTACVLFFGIMLLASPALLFFTGPAPTWFTITGILCAIGLALVCTILYFSISNASVLPDKNTPPLRNIRNVPRDTTMARTLNRPTTTAPLRDRLEVETPCLPPLSNYSCIQNPLYQRIHPLLEERKDDTINCMIKKYYHTPFCTLSTYIRTTNIRTPGKKTDIRTYINSAPFLSLQRRLDQGTESNRDIVNRSSGDVRGMHGTTHAIRCAVLIPMLIQLFYCYVPEAFEMTHNGTTYHLLYDKELIFLLMMAALMHDSANSGEDGQNDANSNQYMHAMFFYHEMMKRGHDENKVHLVAEAMRDKEYQHHLNKKYFCNLLSNLLDLVDNMDVLRCPLTRKFKTVHTLDPTALKAHVFGDEKNRNVWFDIRVIQPDFPKLLSEDIKMDLLVNQVMLITRFYENGFKKEHEVWKSAKPWTCTLDVINDYESNRIQQNQNNEEKVNNNPSLS